MVVVVVQPAHWPLAITGFPLSGVWSSAESDGSECGSPQPACSAASTEESAAWMNGMVFVFLKCVVSQAFLIVSLCSCCFFFLLWHFEKKAHTHTHMKRIPDDLYNRNAVAPISCRFSCCFLESTPSWECCCFLQESVGLLYEEYGSGLPTSSLSQWTLQTLRVVKQGRNGFCSYNWTLTHHNLCSMYTLNMGCFWWV